MSTGRRIWYVECAQFRSHPTTYAQARHLADSLNDEADQPSLLRSADTCTDPHKVRRLVMLADYLDLPEPTFSPETLPQAQ